MPGERDNFLASLGYPLDRVPAVAAIYKPIVVEGSTVYASGNLPIDGDLLTSKGKVASAIALADAKKAAALCMANVLRQLCRHIGSLDRIERVLRTAGYVNSDPDFIEQHLVVNGASELLCQIFGEAGAGVRSAIGVASLPLGASVEVDVIFQLKSDLRS